jgi:hypothetical protein
MIYGFCISKCEMCDDYDLIESVLDQIFKHFLNSLNQHRYEYGDENVRQVDPATVFIGLDFFRKKEFDISGVYRPRSGLCLEIRKTGRTI